MRRARSRISTLMVAPCGSLAHNPTRGRIAPTAAAERARQASHRLGPPVLDRKAADATAAQGSFTISRDDRHHFVLATRRSVAPTGAYPAIAVPFPEQDHAGLCRYHRVCHTHGPTRAMMASQMSRSTTASGLVIAGPSAYPNLSDNLPELRSVRWCRILGRSAAILISLRRRRLRSWLSLRSLW